MNILTVFTGGTIGSAKQDGVLSPDGKTAYQLLEHYQTTYGAAAFETAAPYTILSENLCADNLKSLRACLEQALRQSYDGIIVTHGTDTLAYTAAYLDFVFGAKDIPIVLVSANYPLSDSRSNGLDNFAAAVDFIRSRAANGVFVAYKNTGDSAATIHRGVCVLPHLPYSDSVFSIFNEYFGTVSDGSFVKNHACQQPEPEDLSSCELGGKVLYIRPYVGISYPEITDGVKAILLEGWHSGTLPTASASLRRFCEQAAHMGVPVYLTGDQPGFNYAGKLAYEQLHIISLPPMSPIAAYMKLWLSLP